MASNKVSWMTPRAGNNIRPNRHQLASIEYENAKKKNRLLPCGTKFPSAGTGTPQWGPVPLPEDRIPLGRDRYPSAGTAIMYGGLLEDCKFKHENP